ncbi:enoyl-CoA hydratase/isomerase family protein [Mycobacterium avium subsp. avium 2285 (R)]|nr:enoyl-CoA hydratase/isomerase family protein [Mycobacterium avium subsp. avium 2285 (R)]
MIGRLERTGERFLAMGLEDDDEILDLLTGENPAGERVYVRAFATGNRVTTSRRRMDSLRPRRTPGFRDSYEFVQVERDGHLLVVTINRPESRNALHPPAHEELDEIFDAYIADPGLWVAILTGAGTAAFCAGNDLIYTGTGKPVYIPLSGFAGLTSRRRLPKPIIAAVNGYAMGGGLETALACHLIVADENAKLALSEVQVGLVAGAGGAVRLPQQLQHNRGPGPALDHNCDDNADDSCVPDYSHNTTSPPVKGLFMATARSWQTGECGPPTASVLPRSRR